MGVEHDITRTQGEEHHTLGPVVEWGEGEGRALGQVPNSCGAYNLDDGLIGAAANHHGTCIPK